MTGHNVMRAVRAARPGGPEVLELVHVPVPVPGPGQVLIAVQAAGINRPDLSQRRGTYPVPADASPTLGLEVAGTLAALGPGVTGWAVGVPVAALVHGGGYADFAIAEAGQVLALPAGLDVIEAAALPEVGLTVEYNLIERAGLKAGEWALIHGGSSGIGAHAIQRAKAAGAHVAVTAGSDEKCAWCRRLGADLAVNYRSGDFVPAMRAASGGRGADVILDMVGGPYVDRNLAALAEDGRCAVISLQGGRRIEADLEPLLRRRLSLIGATLRPLPGTEKARLVARLVRDVLPMVTDGRIRPQVAATFPLEAVAEAHALLESGTNMGKIVLRCQPD